MNCFIFFRIYILHWSRTQLRLYSDGEKVSLEEVKNRFDRFMVKDFVIAAFAVRRKVRK